MMAIGLGLMASIHTGGGAAMPSGSVLAEDGLAPAATGDLDGILVNVNGGGWQTLTAAGYSFSSMDGQDMLLTGPDQTGNTVQVTHEAGTDEPYRNAGTPADNTVVKGIYITDGAWSPSAADGSANKCIHGIPITPNYDGAVTAT